MREEEGRAISLSAPSLLWCLLHSFLDSLPSRLPYFSLDSSNMIPAPPSALISGWVPRHPSVCSLYLPTPQYSSSFSKSPALEVNCFLPAS